MYYKLMLNKHYTLLFLLGLFLMHVASFACGSTSCCKKEQAAVSKSCCKKEITSKKNSGCNKKCKHPSCRCTISIFNLTLPNSPEIPINHFDFSAIQPKFFFVGANLSSGFYTIWSPPNIG